MTGDPISQVMAAGPAAAATAMLAVALIVTGVAWTVLTRPWTSVGVLVAGVAVLGAMAVVL